MTQVSNKPLAGKTAVVTGSSSGVGRAIAVCLARAGASALIHAGRNAEGAGEAAKEMQSLGVEAKAIVADFSDAERVASFADEAWAWRQGVDIWINNAGADVLTGDAAKWSFDEKLDHLWQVDVRATIALSRSIGQRMKQRGGGVLVNIGWDRAETGMEGDSGEMFAAVKGAIACFTRSLAQSLAPEVRVNCVAPGWIQTKWGRNASEYWQSRAAAESLAGRWGMPEDVASAVLFLVSPGAEFIVGETIAVDGGFRHAAHRHES
jgi:3-oxoacyl-[acyl-carrier protein] reductase